MTILNKSEMTNKESKMAVYRVTRFAGSDMDKAVEIAKSMRDVLEGLGADLIDIASD